jgi:flagellar motility protein MotE (MotC chaperone)
MKPKDAARILNTLETDILIAVMERMSERKSAPILAEMDSDRARQVTTLLAERKQLPNLDL